MTTPLHEFEVEALEIREGTREGTWGAWFGAVCESLHARGYCTHEYGGSITPAGRDALAKLKGASRE